VDHQHEPCNLEVLTPAQAADYLGVSRATLIDWIKRGIGPPRLPYSYHFVRITLDAWRGANQRRLQAASNLGAVNASPRS
jgi:excisionase family DNA binding protein